MAGPSQGIGQALSTLSVAQEAAALKASALPDTGWRRALGAGTMEPPAKRARRHTDPQPPAQAAHASMAQLAGLCISLYLAVPSARFRTRSFYDVLKAHDVYSRGYHHMVKLSEAALTDLRWWATLADNNVSRAIWRPPCTATMWVDASKIPGAGSGAILSGPRPEDGTTPARSIWAKQELLRSINFLETRVRTVSGRTYGRALEKQQHGRTVGRVYIF